MNGTESDSVETESASSDEEVEEYNNRMAVMAMTNGHSESDTSGDENNDPFIGRSSRSRTRGNNGNCNGKKDVVDVPPASPTASTASSSKGSGGEANSRTSSSMNNKRRGVNGNMKMTVKENEKEEDREETPTPSTSSASGSTKGRGRSPGPKSKTKGKGMRRNGRFKGKKAKGGPGNKDKQQQLRADECEEEEVVIPPEIPEDEYIVESIVGRKYILTSEGKKLHYEIKWKNWPHANNTWEPEENLDGCQNLVDKFETERAVREALGDASDSSEEDSDEDLSQIEKENGRKGGGAHTYLAKKKRKLQYLGIEKKWPVNLIPTEVVTVVHLVRTICYVVKHQTPKEQKGLTSSNCVLVKSKTFRYLYPQIVIKYYEDCIKLSLLAATAENEAKEQVVNPIVKLEVKSGDEENGDGNEEAPKVKRGRPGPKSKKRDNYVHDDLFTPVKKNKGKK